MKDKIKTFFDSKTFFVILSIVLAICAWLLVLSYTNPIKSRTMEKPALDGMLARASSKMKQQAQQGMKELDKQISFSDTGR